jgi:hypothetical protein
MLEPCVIGKEILFYLQTVSSGMIRFDGHITRLKVIAVLYSLRPQIFDI